MPEHTTNTKLKLLLIDGDSSTGDSIETITKPCDGVHYLGQAYQTLEGINLMQQYVPDLVIIDFHVPGSSGFDLLKWTKENYPKIKVIIISDSLKPEYKEISESLGADYYLDKQRELYKIAVIIQTLAASHSLINK